MVPMSLKGPDKLPRPRQALDPNPPRDGGREGAEAKGWTPFFSGRAWAPLNHGSTDKTCPVSHRSTDHAPRRCPPGRPRRAPLPPPRRGSCWRTRPRCSAAGLHCRSCRTFKNRHLRRPLLVCDLQSVGNTTSGTWTEGGVREGADVGLRLLPRCLPQGKIQALRDWRTRLGTRGHGGRRLG